MPKYIEIKGARQHNLRNVDIKIPRDKFVVITGLSGSGKSTLAFDTIFAEGQRRYVESLSAYARQFLGQMKKPKVDYIDGLSPAISIDQKAASKNPRSTVGTVTEIYDYLRLLYARIGKPHCHICGQVIEKQTVDQIVDKIMELDEGQRIDIMAPVVRDRKGEYKELFNDLKRKGFVRTRVDGKRLRIGEEPIDLDRYKIHTIEAVVDRLRIKKSNKKTSSLTRRKLTDSVEISLNLAEGVVHVFRNMGAMENTPKNKKGPKKTKKDGKRILELSFSDKDFQGETMVLSTSFACQDCGVGFDELLPRMFSFNSPHGACPRCHGLGTKKYVDPELVIPDGNLTIIEGAIDSWGNNPDSYYMRILEQVGESHGFDLHTPWKALKKKQKEVILFGAGSKRMMFKYYNPEKGTRWEHRGHYEGVITSLERRYRQTNSPHMRHHYEKFMSELPCQDCSGMRLKPQSLAVTVGSLDISSLTSLTVAESLAFVEGLELSDREEQIAGEVIKEVRGRLQFLSNVGLDYLSLDRASRTLSGGESQRIRLATQIGSRLVGVLYILDEPTIGLHQRDNQRLIKTLVELKNLGNTLLVVEHDEGTILASDHVVDLGPGAGEHGGEVVAQGTPKAIMRSRRSITGQYLSGKLEISVPDQRIKPRGKYLTVVGAAQNNLKNIDVKIPIGLFTCITGVSGSGKSSLVDDILHKALARYFYRAKTRPGKHKDIQGLEHLDKVIIIDQSPIGRTPRSNPATYTGVMDHIRDVFARTKDARIRGFKKGRFSFNVKGGRCEACSGAGIVKIEMHFLPDIYIPCDVCKGKRFNRETLLVKYREKNITQVLNMTVSQCLEHFSAVQAIVNKLQTLEDVGLGYIRLGQSATTLSGGEAQRIKLAKELSKRGTGQTLYILDEPTTGLHFHDVKKLLNVLIRLRSNGNTMVIIEHNLDVIKCADWIIDLGPEGGDGGGYIVGEGSPEDISDMETHTGEFLRRVLKP